MSHGGNCMGEGHHHGQDTGGGLIRWSTAQLMHQDDVLFMRWTHGK